MLPEQIAHMSDSMTIVRARVPARRLRRAGKILDKFGLKPDDAFNMLLAQIELRQGLPFAVGMNPLLSAEEQADAWTEAYGAY
jgi:antitoxin component of RelBE/YafQ-DinJ toxin-antitoxin module